MTIVRCIVRRNPQKTSNCEVVVTYEGSCTDVDLLNVSFGSSYCMLDYWGGNTPVHTQFPWNTADRWIDYALNMLYISSPSSALLEDNQA